MEDEALYNLCAPFATPHFSLCVKEFYGFVDLKQKTFPW